MTRCESYPPCFGTIYFPTAPYCHRFLFNSVLVLSPYRFRKNFFPIPA